MEIHIGHLIREELDKQQRSVAWFARQINITRPHAYRIFEKEILDIKLVEQISLTLNRDFFADLSRALNLG